MFKGFGAFSRILYFRVQIGTKTNLFYRGLVVYGAFKLFMLWLGAFRRILYIGVPYSRKKNTYHSIDSRLL